MIFSEEDMVMVCKVQARIRGWLHRHPWGKGRVQHSRPADGAIESTGPKSKVAEADVLNLAKHWYVMGEYKTFPSDDLLSAAFDMLGSKISPADKPVTRQKFMSFAGWKQARYLKLLGEKPPFTYKFPHNEVRPRESLDAPIPWSECVGAARSYAGSEGVIFVELPEKEAVCVKVPSKVAAEMFGTMLCERIGIRCPRMRIVRQDSEEGQLISGSLIRVDSRLPPENQRIAAMLSKSPALLIIEYLQGVELADKIPPHCADWGADTFGQAGVLSQNGCDVLRRFGSLIAFDMLINNYDRLPCIWDNGGNPGNVMFSSRDNSVISIDNMVNCIHAGNKDIMEQFLKRVHSATRSVISNPDVEHKDFAKIRTLLREGAPGHGWGGLAIDIGEAGTLEVQNGFVSTVQLIVEGDSAAESDAGITFEELSQMRNELFMLFRNDLPSGALTGAVPADGIELRGFESISPEFIGKVVDVFRDALAEGIARGGQQSADLDDLRVELNRSSSHRSCEADMMWGLDGQQHQMGPSVEQQLEIIGRLQQAVRETGQRERVISECNAKLLHLVRTRREAKLQAVKAAAAVPGAQMFYALAELTCRPPWPEGVEPSSRERWLSPEDFKSTFGMDLQAWDILPQWKRTQMKKQKALF